MVYERMPSEKAELVSQSMKFTLSCSVFQSISMILFLYLFLYVCFYGKEALMYVLMMEWFYGYFFFFLENLIDFICKYGKAYLWKLAVSRVVCMASKKKFMFKSCVKT